jgi:multidrug efflux pump
MNVRRFTSWRERIQALLRTAFEFEQRTTILVMHHASETGDLSEIKGFTGWYLGVLNVALKIPGLILASALIILVGVQIAYGVFGKGVEFFPDIEPDFASVLVHARGNLSVYEQDKIAREVEERILGLDGVKTVYTRTGKSAQRGSDLAEDVIAQFQLQFENWSIRNTADEILDGIRENTRDIPGIKVETRKQEGGPPTGKAVQIQISTRFPEKLEKNTELVLNALDEIGGFRDVEDSRPLPGIDWELDVDRAQAAKFNLNISTIGQYIRMITNGLKAAEYRPNDSDEEIDIVIRHDFEQRTLDQLDQVRIETPSGGSVPISSFVERKAKPAVGVINRVDQRRVVTVQADVPPGTNIAAKVEDIKNWMLNNQGRLDPTVDISFKGEDEDQRRSQAFLIKAFGVALFMMAVILVTQFNSFYNALLILSAVIMSTIGVMIGLMITGQPFGIIMSGIGVIALAGIIVNNNIVLIDTFDQLKKNYGDKMDLREVILRTGAQRLRPVLLTTVTTVVGLMPMVLQLNIDFVSRAISVGAPSTQWWVQLATAIVFGLCFSTVLTLIVTPSALMFQGNASRALTRAKGSMKRKFQS